MSKRSGKAKKEKEVAAYDIEVVRAADYDDMVFFDVKINGVMIYGCRYMEGKDGDFIAFPSKKGKDGKYYNHAWIKLEADHVALIDEQIDKLLS